MKNLIPVILMSVMLIMLLISWDSVISYHSDVTKEYNRHIENAESYEGKKIYIDAVREYSAALEMQPQNYELAMKVAEMYRLLENKASYMTALKNAVKADPTQLDPYIILSDYYFEVMNYEDAYTLLKGAKDHIDSEEIKTRLLMLMGQYSLSTQKYPELGAYFYETGKTTGYAVFCDGEHYGILDTDAGVKIACKYEDIGIMTADLAPVRLDGEWYYVNAAGYRKLVPDTPVDWLGSFGNHYAPASHGTTYGYLDKNMKEHHFEYSYAGCFANGLAAVQKDGKWAVINPSFETVVDFMFDDIVMDEYGFCSAYGVFFAKKDGAYRLYNASGKAISEGFDAAKPFSSKEPAAVCKNGKWGFLSITGTVVVEPAYEDAQSFCIGYAPVCTDTMWGCIDEDGNIVIEPIFEAMEPFSQNGIARVTDGGVEKILTIKMYE